MTYYGGSAVTDLSGEDLDLFVDTRDNKHFRRVTNEFIELIGGVVDLRRDQSREELKEVENLLLDEFNAQLDQERVQLEDAEKELERIEQELRPINIILESSESQL